MYRYMYIEVDASGIFKPANHRTLIDKHSADGWRFVTAIPTVMNGHGVIQKFDLVFEKNI